MSSKYLLDLVRRRAPSRPVALVRISVGLAAILQGGVSYYLLPALFPGDVVRIRDFPWIPDLSPSTLPIYLAIWLAAAVGFTLGWRTRFSGAVLTAAIAYHLVVDHGVYSNHLYLLGLDVFLLTIAESGAWASVDSRRVRTKEEVPAWPIVLCAVQLSLVYGFTALAKINPEFLSGSVLRGALALPARLRRRPLLFRSLAIVVIAVESFLAIGLWSTRLRPVAFVLGLGLHGSILMTIRENLFAPPDLDFVVFGLIALGPYVLFLTESPGSRIVIWDDRCSFCRRWISWFQRFDWLGIHRFEGSSSVELLNEAAIAPEEADRELQLRGPNLRRGGFDAVRTILEVLPVSFLWAPLLAVPPIRWIGERLYKAIAIRRKCTYVISPPSGPGTKLRAG